MERRIRRKGKALYNFTLGIYGDEFLCNIINGFLRFFPRLLPIGTAHFLQFRYISFITDVALYQIELIRRYIQDILTGIVDLQVIFMDAVYFYGLNTIIATNTVYFMNNIITDF